MARLRSSGSVAFHVTMLCLSACIIQYAHSAPHHDHEHQHEDWEEEMSAVTDPEPAAPSTAKVIKLQKQDKSFKLADVWNEAEDITRSAANRVYGLFSDTSAKPNSAKDEDEKEYKYSGTSLCEHFLDGEQKSGVEKCPNRLCITREFSTTNTTANQMVVSSVSECDEEDMCGGLGKYKPLLAGECARVAGHYKGKQVTMMVHCAGETPLGGIIPSGHVKCPPACLANSKEPRCNGAGQSGSNVMMMMGMAIAALVLGQHS